MLARLPIPAGPARHETLVSYLTRLAALHAMPTAELWEQLATPRTVGQRGRRHWTVQADRLAVITGRPVEHLARALPELRDPAPNWNLWRHQPQPGCPRCDARHDGGVVLRLLPHHRYVCTRHRYWIGPPDAGQPAIPLGQDLAEVGEQIVAAQHQHRRLLARHDAAAVFDAVLTGFLICGHLWDDRRHESTGAWRHWVQRVDRLIPPGTELDTYSASKLFAAAYPEAVKLAALIASPTWRRLASGDTAQHRTFLAEICRRVDRSPDHDDTANNAIRHWMVFDSHHPPSSPEKTFPQTRDYGATRHTKTSPLSHERTTRGAHWFLINRRGGSSILRHRHLRPVLSRQWAAPMDGIDATIKASASLIDYRNANDRCQHRLSENAR